MLTTLASWLDAYGILLLFGFAFASDLARAGFELAVNFHYRYRSQRTVPLGLSEVAVVIPCHNGADSIAATVSALPRGTTVYCVANNCTDSTAQVVEALRPQHPGLRLIDVDFPGKSKTKAVLLGALQASRDGHSHFLLLDDDVQWPAGRPIEVVDKAVAITAIAVMPSPPRNLIQQYQVFEYIGTNLNKRCQTYFAGDVTWASGAAAVYRLDIFLEVMRMHDGEFHGEDIQCSYLHHYQGYKVDFLPETVVTTDVPRTPQQWWRQRANSWDVSFMFLHIGLLLRVLFRTGEKGPGWWIRLLTFYRIYDALLVLVKLALPLAVLEVPLVMVFFVSSSLLIMGAQYLSYPLFFTALERPPTRTRIPRLVFAFLTFPAYTFLTWVSRLAAVPRVVWMKLHPRPVMGPFIDANFAACSRVGSLGSGAGEQ